jgi:hypothetical protein
VSGARVSDAGFSFSDAGFSDAGFSGAGLPGALVRSCTAADILMTMVGGAVLHERGSASIGDMAEGEEAGSASGYAAARLKLGLDG